MAQIQTAFVAVDKVTANEVSNECARTIRMKDEGWYAWGVNEWLPNYAAAWDWLAHDPLGNLDLLSALAYEPLDEIVLVGDDTMGRAVLLRGPHPTRDEMCCRVAAESEIPLQKLLQVHLQRATDLWLLHRPWVLPMLQSIVPVSPSGYAILGFARDSPSPIPAGGRLLTLDDTALVADSNCGWTASSFRRLWLIGRQPWGIVVDEQLVCRASTGYATPWTEEILGVWTHPDFRGQGLARQLAATLCNDILKRKRIATYTTTSDNYASRRVAVAVGFWSIYESVEYR